MRRYSILTAVLALTLVLAACSSSDQTATTVPGATAETPPATAAPAASSTTSTAAETGPEESSTTTLAAITSSDGCGHDVDPTIIELGFNEVVDADGAIKAPQGRPFQEGDTLRRSASQVSDDNAVAYAQVAALMMPIRDALMCDIASFSRDEWDELTEVLDLNGIKTVQDLSGTPPEQVYSSDGIYELLRAGEDFNAMMKYLEEAELELKCLAFVGFDFTNPEGDNHCQIHGLAEGSGIVLP